MSSRRSCPQLPFLEGITVEHRGYVPSTRAKMLGVIFPFRWRSARRRRRADLLKRKKASFVYAKGNGRESVAGRKEGEKETRIESEFSLLTSGNKFFWNVKRLFRTLKCAGNNETNKETIMYQPEEENKNPRQKNPFFGWIFLLQHTPLIILLKKN